MAESGPSALATTLQTQRRRVTVTPEHTCAGTGTTMINTQMIIVAGSAVSYNLDYGTYGLPQVAQRQPPGVCETHKYQQAYARMEGGALGQDIEEEQEESLTSGSGRLVGFTTDATEEIPLAAGTGTEQHPAGAIDRPYGESNILYLTSMDLHDDAGGTQRRIISHLMDTTMRARTSAPRGRYGEKSWESVRVSVEGSFWPGLSSAVEAIRESVEPGLDEVRVEARFQFESSRRARLVWTISCHGAQYGGNVQVALPKANYKKVKAAHTRGSHTDEDTCAGREGVPGRGLVHKENEGSEVEVGPDVQ